MQAKEGILLDREGNTILMPPGAGRSSSGPWHSANQARAKILQFRASGNPLLWLMVPLILVVVGLFIILGLMVMIPIWILRALFR